MQLIDIRTLSPHMGQPSAPLTLDTPPYGEAIETPQPADHEIHLTHGERMRLYTSGWFDLGCVLLLLLLMCAALFGCAGGYAGIELRGVTATASTLDAGQSTRLTVNTSGSLPITWSLSGNGCSGNDCGTLSGSGESTVYTAPLSLTTPVQVTLTATVAGTNSSKTAVITVNPDPTIVGSPVSGTVGASYSYTLSTKPGTGKVTMMQAGGALPAGLSFDASTGVISGTPTTAGSAVLLVSATDEADMPYTVTARETIVIATAGAALGISTTGNLPAGTVGVAYATALVASGGTQPYTWTVISGQLPTGLTLAPDSGLITGTPLVQGTFAFTAEVTDALGAMASASFSITISPLPVHVAIETSQLPNGVVGLAYSSSIVVTGGSSPYACAVVSGSLPSGLSIGAGCVVSGTPSVAGTFSFSVLAMDSSNPAASTTGALSISILPAPVTLQLGSPNSGTVNVAYDGTILVSGGNAPYTCALKAGSLPSGLTFGANCHITGTTATAGQFNLSVTATDSLGHNGSGTITVVIQPSTLAMTTGSLPNGTVLVNYYALLNISGGTGPYSCALVSGSLPLGLTLGSNCAITGIPLLAGTSNFQVRVADAAGQTFTGLLAITINLPAVTIVATAPLPGVVNQPYLGVIGIVGGTGPYTCGLAGGTLPASLTLNANCTITGTPTAAGSSTISVTITDAASPANVITVSITLVINPATLTANAAVPAGTVDVAYDTILQVSGGTAPYLCALASGTLPGGLTLGPDCSITGTPTASGTFTFNVAITDSGSPKQSINTVVTMTIQPASATLTLTAPANGTVNMPYHDAVLVTGGTAPYTCVFASGTLPAGLSLNANCSVTGTPTAAGDYTFSVHVNDSAHPVNTGDGTVTMTIHAAAVTITVGSPLAGVAGQAYTGPLAISGGTAPYTCALASGTLPSGLTLRSDCVVAGLPTVQATAVVQVSVTDAGAPATTVTKPITVEIDAPATLTLAGSAPDATVSLAYSFTPTTQGGVAPYSYAVSAGALPAGLSLDANTGMISGTPTVVGAFSFTVTATDTEQSPQKAVLPLVILVRYAAAPNDSLLSGPYAFLFQGYDDSALGVFAYKTATVGSFVADGAGGLTAGELDSNHQTETVYLASETNGIQVGTHLLRGTYTVGADLRGSMTLATFHADGTVAQNTTYAISVKAAVTPATVATQGSMLESDNVQLAGTRGEGTFLAQDPAAVAAGLNGSYAFGMEGDSPCFPTCVANLSAGPVVAVGRFSAGSQGMISGGTSDVNEANMTYPNAALSGSFGVADGHGRVQLALLNQSIPYAYPADFAVYVVDAAHAFVMSTDKHSDYILLAGTAAQQQTTTTFGNAFLSGAYVGYENAATNPGLVGTTLQNVLNLSTATIFSGTGNGAGVCNTTHVDIAGLTGLVNALTGIGSGSALINDLFGTYSTKGSSSCTVAASGRAVLNYPTPDSALTLALQLLGVAAQPPAPRVAYLTDVDSGYFLETGYAGLGHLEKQTGAPLTLGTLKGTFRYSSQPSASVASVEVSGVFTADGVGTATTTLDSTTLGVGNVSVVSLGTQSSYPYTLNDANAGRYLLGSNQVIYAISPSRYVLVDENPLTTSPSVALLF